MAKKDKKETPVEEIVEETPVEETVEVDPWEEKYNAEHDQLLRLAAEGNTQSQAQNHIQCWKAFLEL